MALEATTVFVTGANRGIGRALAETYLSRPNHTVIASVRNPETTSLRDYKPAADSKLVLVKIEATSDTDPATAVEQIRAAGIATLDILIVNAGINPPSALANVGDIDVKELRELFEVNTYSFVTLFKAVQPLLKVAADRKGEGSPKLLAISSNAAQIVDMEAGIPFRVGAYGASKLALNYLVRRVHFENPWLTAWMMNPGFVQTDTGYAALKAFGLPGLDKPPHTIQVSVAGLVTKIDGATRGETSGNFYNVDGTPLAF